jgi:ComF family protein
MPLHWRRISYRGFNQATIIARYLSKKCHIPVLKQAYVKRIKHTSPQSSLRSQARHTNLKGVFRVEKLPNIIHVGIIDDILTTGNTVNELAKQLKRQGVQRVSVWILARVNR